jgi:hypothetical protein
MLWGAHYHRLPIGTERALDAEPGACKGEHGHKSSWQAGWPRVINDDGMELESGQRSPGHNCALEGISKLRIRQGWPGPVHMAWMRSATALEGGGVV